MKRFSIGTAVFFLILIVHGCRENPRSAPIVTSTPVPIVEPVVVRSFPHDTAAFTQGLLFANGKLYESDGVYGKSALRIVDTLGKEQKRVKVADVFAEGLAFLSGRLVQLTWRESVAYVYDAATLGAKGKFGYHGEGWGLTVQGGQFVMSNGSDTLCWRDAADFHSVRCQQIRYAGRPLKALNELEAARGLIYANVWYSDFIHVIDPATGLVVKVIDCSGLVAQAKKLYKDCDVLNGIAYDETKDLFYVTGKRWPVVFVVKM